MLHIKFCPKNDITIGKVQIPIVACNVSSRLVVKFINSLRDSVGDLQSAVIIRNLFLIGNLFLQFHGFDMILSLQCNVYATKTAMSFRLHVFGEIFYFYLENLLNIVSFLRSNYILFIAAARVETFLEESQEK